MVVRYFNYRKNLSFKILKCFTSFDKADEYAKDCAKAYSDSGYVMDRILKREVHIDDVIDGYTNNDGYKEWVFTVMGAPEAEVEDDVEEDENFMILEKKPETNDNCYEDSDFSDETETDKSESDYDDEDDDTENEIDDDI
jgi:hypothetical protein